MRRPRNPVGFIRARDTKAGRSWQAIVKYPDPDKSGAWKQRSQTFERKAEAKKWADATIAEHRARPDYRPPSEETFGAYMERWLRDVAALRVKGSTLESHRHMAKHAIRAFGRKPLAQLGPTDLQALYASLIERGSATTTVRYVHAVTRKALQDAVEFGLIPVNPADRAKRPRVIRKEIVPPTAAQAQAFLKHVDDDRLRGLWYFIALTGCRRGGALGLRWGDIDFEARTAMIRRTLTGSGARRQMQEPKTTRSRRTIALSSVLIEVLRQHRETQAVEHDAAGELWQGTEYAFTSRRGGWLDPSWTRKRFKRLCKEAGLPEHTRIHDLRHSLATTWLAYGIPAQVVSERLGHANISITLGLYAHVLPGQQAAAAEERFSLVASPRRHHERVKTRKLRRFSRSRGKPKCGRGATRKTRYKAKDRPDHDSHSSGRAT